jgi:uncharacterized protein YggT (Ycf19 family)
MVYLTAFFRLLFLLAYVLLVFLAVAPWLSLGRKDHWLAPLYAVTDRLLNPIRAGLPPEKIGYDVSPYVAIILIYLIQRFLLK